MVEATYSSQRISFLRGVLGVLEANVQEERERIVIAQAHAKTLDEIEAVAARYRELYDRVQGLGNKLLIVGLSSLVESIFRMMLEQHMPGVNLGPRAGWGTLRSKVKLLHGVDVDTLASWNETTLVRLLSNAFKHADGFVEPGSDDANELQACASAIDDATVFDWPNHVHPTDGKIDFGVLQVATYINHVEIFLNDLERLPHQT